MYKTKTINKILYISILLFFTLGSVGCTLSAQDLTPPEQPTWAANWGFMFSLAVSSDELYYPSATFEEIYEADQTFAHWFFLETRPKNVTNVKAFITVNGIEYPMEEYSGSDGKGLWTYQSENMCNGVYDYHYRIRYKRGWYGYATKTIGSAEAPLHSEVAEFGNLVWFTHWRRPSSSTYGEITLYTPEFYDLPSPWEAIIFIQRFTQGTNPIRIAFIGLPYDETKFEIFQRPPVDQELACGDYAEIGVRWNPVPGDYHDDSTLVIACEGYHEGKWSEVRVFQIDLKGRWWWAPS